MSHPPGPPARGFGRVGVVSVTYRSAGTVGALLAGLPVQELAGTVVVDNASDDGTRELVAAHEGVHLVPLDENIGYGRACNVGVEHLPACELVLLVNPDAALAPAELAHLVRWLDDHPDCALVGPRLFRDGTPLASSGERVAPWRLLRLVAPAPLLRALPPWRHDPARDRSGPVGYVEGACVLVRRAAFDDLGGFDPRYFLFFEEMDLARRLAPRWTVDVCAQARAEHVVAASRASQPLEARDHLVRSAALYVERWYGTAAGRAFRRAACALVALRVRAGGLSAQDGARYRRALSSGGTA